jgi:dTDP-4-dehydrorhamnose 3,5-epimerase
MKVSQTELSGVLVIEPQVYGDERGWFLEVWQETRYGEAGLPARFVQDNASWSQHGVLRGLHFQHPRGQGKLVYVLAGEVFDVAVDVRADSPTFGRWTGLTLSAENRKQVYIPPGFAHGFCVTGDSALFAYKCTEAYAPEAERTLLWDDADIAVAWPLIDPIVSDKDRMGALLKDTPRGHLPP